MNENEFVSEFSKCLKAAVCVRQQCANRSTEKTKSRVDFVFHFDKLYSFVLFCTPVCAVDDTTSCPFFFKLLTLKWYRSLNHHNNMHANFKILRPIATSCNTRGLKIILLRIHIFYGSIKFFMDLSMRYTARPRISHFIYIELYFCSLRTKNLFKRQGLLGSSPCSALIHKVAS